MDWRLSPEGDISAYHVYRSVNGGTPNEICPQAMVLSCKDLSPPSSGTVTYWATAMDLIPNTTNRRDGDPSAKIQLSMPNQAPAAPTGLTVTATGGSAVKLQWVASSGDPDGNVIGYAIYRDGTSLTDLYATVSGATTTTWTDPTGLGHSYWVAAIDDKQAQSVKSNGAG
jgi:hypothetical protein